MNTFFNDTHPELRSGEMVLRNTSNPNLIDVLPYAYTRGGVIAYTQAGKLVGGYIPVFVQITEWKRMHPGKRRPDDKDFEAVKNRAPLKPVPRQCIPRPNIETVIELRLERTIPAIMHDRTEPVPKNPMIAGAESPPHRRVQHHTGSTPKASRKPANVLHLGASPASKEQRKRVKIRTFCDRNAVLINGDVRKDGVILLTGDHWMEEHQIGNVLWLVCPESRLGIPKRLAEDSDDPIFGNSRIQILVNS